MTVIAVTGHMDLTEESVLLVREALGAALAEHAADGLTGVSCIAKGADAIFADAVLSLGGELVVVVPSADYRQAKVKPDHAEEFDRLHRAAAEVVVMPHAEADREAYEAANGELLRRADHLFAVWDGRPGSGRGGTADTVAGAREAGVPVTVVWPDGAARRSG
ncbi:MULTISPECIES: hypothetical protein [Kitasatospora]|uniref:Uncharacterized protein n=1 Tax=Kitasatospora setae (strain ATCC 33774 / DSM 43861 / JCM 3304 / KCC A-0304 / NBRC 14216 / KM-6054) TaxID=452652 RepID=E4NEX8_KITSK|nr:MULTISPECIES: hypothetical protein [Kitasatospora]BAJ29914.1 hypothetical protein KSE_41270 [Kitasatospora setae KM-6054]